MITGKTASRVFLVLFLSGIAFGLFVVESGQSMFDEYIGQGGGGVGALLGLVVAGFGYLLIAIAVFWAGIPWAVTAFMSWRESRREIISDESDPGHADSVATEVPEYTFDSSDIPKALVAAWRGDEKLWKVFWIYQWLFGIALISARIISENFGVLAEGVIFLIVAVWFVWVLVAQWRCSFNAHWKGWGYAVRALLFITVVSLLLEAYLVIPFPESL